jgi:7,8-dihydropterin-6-yl-methyl-4-(beta-D-ribofuranosyl)aminobenzene 5'-phosphate synthase
LNDISRIQADSVAITVLMDNYTDVLLPSTKNVLRTGPFLREQLVAEHGFSLYIRVSKDEVENFYLMDAGFTRIGVPHNINALDVDISKVDSIFLSHGHLDHYASFIEVLELINKPIPFITHPDSFLPRYFVLPNGRVLGPWKLNESDLQEANARIMTVKNSIPLGPGILTTGEIERTTDFEKPIVMARIVKNKELVKDQFLDDQSLIINLKDKGLVILTACSHPGIINIIRHSQKITGENKIYAVLGGFHFVGVKEDIIQRTISEFEKINPTYLMPTHCTGFKAMNMISERMPEKFILSSVGSKIIL